MCNAANCLLSVAHPDRIMLEITVTHIRGSSFHPSVLEPALMVVASKDEEQDLFSIIIAVVCQARDVSVVFTHILYCMLARWRRDDLRRRFAIQ